jgi:hypothetical protein
MNSLTSAEHEGAQPISYANIFITSDRAPHGHWIGGPQNGCGGKRKITLPSTRLKLVIQPTGQSLYRPRYALHHHISLKSKFQREKI